MTYQNKQNSILKYLCRYWDSKTDKIEEKIGIWLGVSHRVGSALYYWFLTEKGMIIALTTVQHVTQDEAKNFDIQQSIRDYHLALESAIGTDEVMSDLDGMDTFINE